MSTHFPYYDPTYQYEGYFQKSSHCELRMAKNQLNVVLVIFTEAPSNLGTTITNRLEQLATRVCREFGLDYRDVTFLEHYPDRGYKLPETYREVFYTWDDRGEAHRSERQDVPLDVAQAVLRSFGLL